MPAYSYQCLDCGKRFTVRMSYAEYGQRAVHCPACQSDHLQRIIRPVRMLRSEESRLEESLADPAMLDALDEDPRALGRMMREMSRELGEDLGPEFEEVVDRLEKGQTPEEIEQAMPELAEEFGEDSPPPPEE
ncbi:MAG TPA: zinc ribbon domain-containing protein [Anaerolineae bacterium]|nr:zinc ribbon domain-containing protein [Anaerolineae bacterium]HID84889.1 zinc ribbon domain-containing protein [Anaerolineales bacterium]HIQ07939.1 zinc ribbon domain-containing protein [Anaerolineaceae bacterium]